MMKKIIFLMFVLVGLSACTKEMSVSEGEVFVVEDVEISETTITFRFEGVSEPKVFSVISCQDDRESFPAYKKGNVVLVKDCRVSHVHGPWNGGIVALCIFFLIAGAFIGMVVAAVMEN